MKIKLVSYRNQSSYFINALIYIHTNVFNIFMLKYLWDLRTLCVVEHLRPQKRALHKDDQAQSMSTAEVTSKHTNLCLVVSSRASSRASPEVTLLPPSHSLILILAFCLLRSLHYSFFFEVWKYCGIKWYTWFSMLC